MSYASLVLDVDNTLCGVEGVDWLAQRRGPDVARRIAALTARAMNGELALDAVYGERLAVVRPSRADVDALAKVYRQTSAPGAREAIARMRAAGVQVVLVSGGLRPAIAPLASELRVDLHAVDVFFDDAGAYAGFESESPLTSQHGKLDVVRRLRLPRPCLAVGDGATDLAMRPAVDMFAAFVGFVRRESVVTQVAHEIRTFDELTTYALR